MRLAIQKDEVTHKNGEYQSYSKRWEAMASEQDISITWVNVHTEEAISQIADCDGFMWRSSPGAYPRLLAKRLMPAIEYGCRIPVFPNWKTLWYSEDKIAQSFLLKAAELPIPKTYIFWNYSETRRFIDEAGYPFILKLYSGYQSRNVRLLKSKEEAGFYANLLFNGAITSLNARPNGGYWPILRNVKDVIHGKSLCNPTQDEDVHYNYFYAQEFLENNDFDTRITVIGTRVFAFRRFNRPNDFRASGSGKIDWDPSKIDEKLVRLAFKTARALDVQVVAIDVLRRGGVPVIGELTLSFASWAVRDCPGHWVLEGEPDTGSLRWVAGELRPEDVIFEDFVSDVRRCSS